jgi:ssDNA-binding Zn-finger/Zn-ribbon topoisomerase 1
MCIYINTPYTYRIQWTKTGMNYYGVRYGKKCRPDEFWVKYFTSSDSVTKYRKEHGEPDLIEIRKIFTGNDRVNEACEWEHRVLKRLDVVGRIDYLNRGNGKGIDPRITSAARKGVAPATKGKSMPEVTKQKMRKPKEKVICPHCGKIGGISAMTRHHFDNCGKDIGKITKEKLKQANTKKADRQVVKEIRMLLNSIKSSERHRLTVKFTQGWYQWPDDRLLAIFETLKIETNFILREPTPKKSQKGIPNGRKGIPSPLKDKLGTRKGIPNKNSGKPQTIIVCPHCGKSGGISVMKRHHFDRCGSLLVNPEDFESGESE